MERKMDQVKQGCVWWITGLSGAGKTTIGKILYARLKEKKPNVFRLDGDIGRLAYNDKIGYSREERKEGAYRNGRVCKMIADQGIDVVCCTVSMFDDVRKWNRENLVNYREIFLDVPMEILVERDQKGLYSGTKSGKTHDVVGVDQYVEFPKEPDLIINNDGSKSPDEVVDFILDCFGIQL